MPTNKVATALLRWFDRHGRKHLPWQQRITPYRVWLSEIMLQQTQVDTVIPYFERFVERFPRVTDLARAEQDEVLHLWTGLGYYARARNLHRCARAVCDEWGGAFPSTAAELASLPGIGRSTAAAIASIAFGRAEAILDGNVKRVLARLHGVEGWPGSTKVAAKLWQLAERHMPDTRCGDYTQAIMDLGATLCTRSKPDCTQCPLTSECLAHQQQRTAELPHKKPRKALPQKTVVMLLVQTSDNRILLEQRPPQGIWGGLWSLPEFADTRAAKRYCRERFGAATLEAWPALDHVFSHFKLQINPLRLRIDQAQPAVNDNSGPLWYRLKQPQRIGLAAPVKTLLQRAAQQNP